LNTLYPSITVSCGHSGASTQQTEDILIQNKNHRNDSDSTDRKGARMITHMFNAMNAFHHRDPGIIGLLGSKNLSYYFGIISDGQHTHPYSIVMAHKCHPKGLVLVTDAMSALGLPSGTYKLGTTSVDVVGDTAKISGTKILAGSIASMDECVRRFYSYTSCSIMEAIHAATLHPAKAIQKENSIGSLRVGNKADICILDDALNVKAVFKSGRLAWQHRGTLIHR
jgi:N-acetylglucosamine-6-phosphate deacetylase